MVVIASPSEQDVRKHLDHPYHVFPFPPPPSRKIQHLLVFGLKYNTPELLIGHFIYASRVVVIHQY